MKDPESKQEINYVNATPDENYPVRILESYIYEDSTWTDNTLGLPPDNPLCVALNETQRKRNEILRRAIVKLNSQ